MSNRYQTAERETAKRPDSSRTAEAKARTCERKAARTAKAIVVTMGGAK